MGFFNDLATTVSDTQIKDYLTANPNLTGQQLADAMKTYNVSPEQLVKAVGAGPDTAANVGGTFYQPQYASTGSGETFQQGPLTGLLSYSEAANKPGGGYNVFDPTGKFTGTGTQQKVDSNMLPFLLALPLCVGVLAVVLKNYWAVLAQQVQAQVQHLKHLTQVLPQ